MIRTPPWKLPELVLAAVLSGLGIPVAGLLAYLNTHLGMRFGLTLGGSVLAVLILGAVLRLLALLGLRMEGPRSVVGMQAAWGGASAGAVIPLFLFPAYYGLAAPGWGVFVALPAAGAAAGVGIALLLGRLYLDLPERGELFAEARAHARAAQSFFAGPATALAALAGGAVGTLHGVLTRVLGFARESAVGFQVGGARGPFFGLSHDVELLGVGYLAGPRVGVALLATALAGRGLLLPLVTYLLPESALPEAGAGPYGLAHQVSRWVAVGVLAGAPFGYLLWGVLGLRERRAARVGSGAPETAWIAGGALLVALIAAAVGFSAAGMPIPLVLASAPLALVLALLGATALVRATATLGESFVTVLGLLLALGLPLAATPLLGGGSGRALSVLLLVQVAGSAAVVAALTAQTLRSGDLLAYPRTPILVQVPLFVLLGGLVGAFVVRRLHGQFGVGSPELPAPAANLLTSALSDAAAGAFQHWPLVALGLILGLGLAAARLPALGVALGFYLPVPTVVTLAAGGLLRLLWAKRDDGKAGAVAAGLIAGAAVASMAEAARFAMGSYPELGERVLRGLAGTGWPGLPTLGLAVLLLLGAALLDRRRQPGAAGSSQAPTFEPQAGGTGR